MRSQQPSMLSNTVFIIACVFFLTLLVIPIAYAAAPTIDTLVVNSSHISNITTRNLTAYVTATDTDGDNVSIVYDWRRNGTSIAVVNLNFDVNNSAGTNIAKDYSRFLNNGTAKVDSGVIGCSAYGWNATAGRNRTGAMTFCTNTNFSVNMTFLPNITRNFTYEMWIYVSSYTNGLVTNGLGSTFVDRTVSTNPLSSLKAVGGSYAFQYRNDSGVAAAALTGSPIVLNTWQHVVWGRNSGTELFIYVDGVKTSMADVGGILTVQIPKLGKHLSNANTGFNGTIDEFRLYNRTLSHDEIMALYRNETNRIVRRELFANDNWTVCVTPNDGTQDGTTSCTTGLSINANQAPTVSGITLTSSDGSNSPTSDLIATLTVSHPEEDNIANATDWRRNGTSIAVVNLNFDVEDSNGTNSVRSYSTHPTNASVSGATWNESGGRAGTSAYSFDGTNDGMSIPHGSAVNFTGNITVSAWVYPRDSAAEYDKIVVKTWSSDVSPYAVISLQRNASTQAYAFGVATGGVWSGSISTSQAPLNAWTHILGRYNGTHTALFFNGVQQDADVKTGALNTTTRPIDIGYNSYGREEFNGMIDDLMIFNRSLSNDEITLLYQNNTLRLANDELTVNDNWTACVTPNDGYLDGVTTCSSGMLIVNTCPDASGIWTVSTPTTQSTSVGNCTLINVTNGTTLTLANNITVSTTVFVIENGTVTHSSLGRVNITTTNLTITENGAINASDKGYDGGGGNIGTNGSGPGAGAGHAEATYLPGNGAAHGGYGGAGEDHPGTTTITEYGNITVPTQVGSGGASGDDFTGAAPVGGAGGGMMLINVTDTINVTGSLTSNGEAGATGGIYAGGGGGSGGSIWILAQTLTGTGSITSNGGAGGSGSNGYGGGGAGGRVSITYTTNAYTGVITATGGSGTNGENGGAGTIYLYDRTAARQELRIHNSIYPTGITAVNTTFGPAVYQHLNLTNTTINSTTFTITDTVTMNPGIVYTNGVIEGTSNITILSGAIATHTDNDASNAYWLNFTGANIFILPGGEINVYARGYAGGAISTCCSAVSGNGPGAGAGHPAETYGPGDGGAYGGYGGAGEEDIGSPTITEYGNISAPTHLGSGGGSGEDFSGAQPSGGDGGGLIILNATNSINISGTINASGGVGAAGGTYAGGGGGSGGGVWITTQTVTGNGTIISDGGSGGTGNNGDGGGGAGGRISITYATSTHNGIIQASGSEGTSGEDGGAGTVYLKDTTTGKDELRIQNSIYPTGITLVNTTLGALTYTFLNITNITLKGDALTITDTTTINPGTTYLNCTLNVATTLLINPGTTYLTSPITGTSNTTIMSGSTITHLSGSSTAPYNVTIIAANITIESGATIDVTAKGYAGGTTNINGYGPGGGDDTTTNANGGSGATHGGRGGDGYAHTNIANSTPNGNLTNPTTAGSGGGGDDGGEGGGVIILNATNAIINNGSIIANGTQGTDPGFGAGGGGAGGSILIITHNITGNGRITANGGIAQNNGGSTDESGAGGGGRIGIYYDLWGYTGNLTAYGGTTDGAGFAAGAGTIYLRNTSSNTDTLRISNGPGDVTGITNLTSSIAPASFNNLDITNTTLDGMLLTITTTLVANQGTIYLNNIIAGTSDITVTTGSTITHTDISTQDIKRVNLSGNSITVQSGGAINVSGRGYTGGSTNADGNGPGAGDGDSNGNNGGGGGGHGGSGADGETAANKGNTTSYDDVLFPTQHGSGGGGDVGGDGGGVIILNAITINITGTVESNGLIGSATTDGGGSGAGGAIAINSTRIVGSGIISAKGGNSYDDAGGGDDGGAGGGGRISISFTNDTSTISLSVKGGVNGSTATSPASDGTIFRCQWSGNMSCPGSIGNIALRTLYLRNQTVNITRNLTTDWNDTRMVWNETASQPSTIGEYTLATLTYSNYKVWHNSTFNDSILKNNSGALATFRTNISGMMQISVLAPNNTAPFGVNVTLNGSRHGTQVFPNEDLLCYVNASDADDFQVEATWTWYNGSTLYNNSKINITTNVPLALVANLSAAVTNPSETWTCGVVISDSYTNIAQVNSSRTLELTQAPELVTVNITPQPAYTTDTLQGWCNATDGDNDTIVYYYAWYKNGVLNTSGVATNGGANYTQGVLVNIASIVPSLTTKNENWTLQCMASQTIANSTIQNITIQIQNIITTVSSLIVNTTNGTNTTGQDIVAYVALNADGDNDTKILYDWRKNGTSLLLHQFPFDTNNSAGTGSTKGYTTRGINASESGATWNATGGYNNTGAYEFDGSNDYLTVTDPYNPTAYTLETWVRPHDTTSANILVFSTGNPASSYTNIIGFTAGGLPTHYLYDGGGNSVTGTTVIAADQWVHIAATVERSGLAHLYVNGVEEGTPVVIGTPATGGVWYIGRSSGLYGYFNGTIDNVRIWNRSLSAAQIALLYQNRTERILAAETTLAENWTACVTAMDDQNETSTCASVNIGIGNTPTATPTIASANGRNSSNEDLTVTPGIVDADGDTTFSAIDWRVNGTSIAVVNMNFDTNNSNGTGSTRDYSTHGNNGSVSGAVWRERQGYGGSSAYEFDGSNDYINLTNRTSMNLGTTNRFTLAAWVKPAVSPPGTGIITEQYTAGADSIQYALGFGLTTATTAVPQVAFYNGTAWKSSTYGTGPTSGVWTHYAGVWNGTHLNLYVNGALVNSTAYASTSLPAGGVQQYWIGRRHDTGGTYDFFPGFLDEVLVMNRSLSGEQILSIYQNRTDVLKGMELAVGQNWSACVTPNDGWNQGNTVCSEGLLITQGVTTQNANITPATAYTNDILLGWCNATGSSASVTYHYAWFYNGTLNTSGYATNGGANYTNGLLVNIANMSAASTTRGDSWIFSCLATDLDINSTTHLNSTTTTILNSPPIISSSILNSTSPYNASNGNLTAYITGADNDSDSTVFGYDWRVNGTSIAVLNMHFDVNNSNGTGKTRDYSNHNNNGTITNAIWNATGGRNSTGAYYFDGAGDSIDIASSATFGGPQVTISAWVNSPIADQGAGYHRIVDRSSVNSFYLGTDTTGTLFKGIFANNVAPYGTLNSVTTITAGTWYHVVVTHNGSLDMLYVNGVNEANQTNAVALASTADTVSIGRYADGASNYWTGHIDNVMIFNRSLSPPQVLALYNNRTDLIVSNELTANQNWTACVTPNDRGDDGSTTCTAGLLVFDTVPVMNTARINPTPTAYLTDNITGYCNATSPVNNLVTYNFTWYKTNATNANVIIEQGVAFAEGSIDRTYSHTCGIRANDSRVMCWGLNGNGQIGVGNTTTPIMRPVPINDTSAYKQVTVGSDHTCGIRAIDNRVLCWGLNTNGRTGNGSSAAVNVLNPRLINDTSAYANISAGAAHTCGIRANDSRVLCWGDNTNGEIGDGTQINRNLTTLTLDTSSYKQVSAGTDHTCGINATTGRVMCWGSNSFGVLGTGNGSAAILRPTAMRNTSAFLQISAGTFHTCGIRSVDNRVLCWGINQNGEGGNGSSGGGLTSLNATFTNDTSPYVKIAAGDSVTCGIRANDSRVLCWGEDSLGGNGDGSAGADNLVPTLTADTNPQVHIAVGYMGACSVRANDTRVLCWGYNAQGQVGDGSVTSPRASPVVTTDSSSYYVGFVSGVEALVDQLNISLVTPKDNITFSCLPSDTVGYGIALNSSVTRVQNFLNLTNASITPAIAYTGLDLLGWCNGTSSGTEGVSYYWSWYRNNTLNLSGQNTNTGQNYTAGLLTNIANLTSGNLSAGTNWTFSCIVNDGDTNSSSRNSSTLVVRLNVNTTGANITPTTAYNNDILFGWCNGTNGIATNITYHYAWFRNGTLNTTGYATSGGENYTQGILINVANVTAANTTPADQWIISCLASDGANNASWRNSTTITVHSTPPTMASLIVNSTHGTNTTSENLTATPVSLTDSEGDAIRVGYDWRVNGTSIALLNLNFDVNNSAGTGLTKDYSTYGRNGTATGGNIWNATGGFNGTGAYEGRGSQYFTLPTASFTSLNNFTMEAWIPRVNNGSSQEQPLLAMYLRNTDIAECGPDDGWRWYIYNGKVCFDDWGSGDASLCSNTSIAGIPNTTATHIVTVRSGTRVLHYINGVLAGNITFHGNPVTSGQTLQIGFEDPQFYWFNGDTCEYTPGFAKYYSGAIDNLRVYSRSLTAAQITTLYNNRTDTIMSQEVSLNQNWTACATPNDGDTEGSTTCSTGLLITTAVTDSCTPPSIDNNWLVYAADNCTKTLTSIALGTGNLTVSGERGVGYLRLNATNVTANNVNVVGYGNLTRIILENSAHVAIN